MKASEVAAKLLELAEKHGDPHVYAMCRGSEVVHAVEPETVVCAVEKPTPMIIIAGMTMHDKLALMEKQNPGTVIHSKPVRIPVYGIK